MGLQVCPLVDMLTSLGVVWVLAGLGSKSAGCIFTMFINLAKMGLQVCPFVDKLTPLGCGLGVGVLEFKICVIQFP